MMNQTYSSSIFAKMVATLLAITFALPAFAVEGNEVQYIGGTVSTAAQGAIGRLDTTNEKELKFVTPGSTLAIEYAKIDSYEYTKEVAHHLGVVPTLALVMVKYRQRRHYFRISYRDDKDVAQSVVLEVPKEMPRAVSAVLEARVPKACIGARFGSCNLSSK